jgi:hypothetical protein
MLAKTSLVSLLLYCHWNSQVFCTVSYCPIAMMYRLYPKGIVAGNIQA